MADLISFSDPINDWEESEEQDGYSRSYTTEHLAIADGLMSTAEVKADPLCPQQHVDTAPWDAEATCRKRVVIPQDDGVTFLVRVEWDTRREAEQSESDPLLRPVTGRRRCQDVEIPAWQDAIGKPLVNTAGKLYQGQTITASTVVVSVRALFDHYPTELEAFNNTVNAAPVNIHGVAYPSRTCWMKNLDMDDQPKEEASVEFYEATYDIVIDPRGYWSLLPNAGAVYLEYQTRATTSAAWVPVSFATYDAEADEDLRQIVEKRNLDDTGHDAGQDTWLDRHGQKLRPVFSDTPLGEGAMTAGSNVLTVTGASFTDAHIGASVTFAEQGPFKKPITALITAVTGATTVTLNVTCGTTFSEVDVYLSGALFNVFLKQPHVSWSALPLPPAPPSL